MHALEGNWFRLFFFCGADRKEAEKLQKAKEEEEGGKFGVKN